MPIPGLDDSSLLAQLKQYLRWRGAETEDETCVSTPLRSTSPFSNVNAMCHSIIFCVFFYIVKHLFASKVSRMHSCTRYSVRGRVCSGWTVRALVCVFCVGRKLRLWKDPDTRTQKISLGVSMRQNTWTVHKLPTPSRTITNADDSSDAQFTDAEGKTDDGDHEASVGGGV